MLDVRRLQVLNAVVATGSVTAAARTLGYTASAISQSLAALEREAKTPLFEKAGRGIRPTQAGLLLAEHSDAVLEQLQRAEEALDALRAGEAGRLRVATFATAGASLVPRAMARFAEMHPGVELDVSIDEEDGALAALRAGHIDLAIVGEHDPAVASAPELEYLLLMEDPYRLVLPRSHPAARKRTISLADLSEERWISATSARCNCMPTVAAACVRAGFTPHFALEADEFATAIGYVAAGLGVTMVPMLGLASVPDDVRVCRIKDVEPTRYVYAVTRRGQRDPMVAAMAEALRLSAGSYLQSVA